MRVAPPSLQPPVQDAPLSLPSPTLGSLRVPPTEQLQGLALEHQPVVANTPTGRERGAIPPLQARAGLQGSPASSSGDGTGRRGAAYISTPTARESRLGLGSMAVEGSGDFHMQHCLALVLSHPAAADSLTALARILRNLLTRSQEPKYRQIRLGNAKVQELIVSVNGAVEFLEACGFEFMFEDKAPGEQGEQAAAAAVEGYAFLPDSSGLSHVQTGWRELSSVMTAHGIPLPEAPSPAPEPQAPAAGQAAPSRLPDPSTRSPTGAARQQQQQPPAQPVPRQTQVLLPVTPDTQVPDWFFERTGADVKAEYLRLVKRREEGEVLTTRAHREKERAGAAVTHTQASVRVRFPEGVCLQGQFGVHEPLTSIFEWVTASLRYPGLTYELITPARRPLPDRGTVKQGDLAPSCVLNFRITTGSVQQFSDVPFLSDALLQQTRTEE